MKADKARNKAVMDNETEFYGELVFDDFLSLGGYFEGSIRTEGVLVIEKTAEVRAEIQAGHLVVMGKVHGNVVVSQGIELIGKAGIEGNIRTPSIFMEPGTAVNGFCEMIDNPGKIDIFSLPVFRLRDEFNLVE